MAHFYLAFATDPFRARDPHALRAWAALFEDVLTLTQTTEPDGGARFALHADHDGGMPDARLPAPGEAPAFDGHVQVDFLAELARHVAPGHHALVRQVGFSSRHEPGHIHGFTARVAQHQITTLTLDDLDHATGKAGEGDATGQGDAPQTQENP